MKKFLLTLALCLAIPSFAAASWYELNLYKPSSGHWVLAENPSPDRHGAYYIENTTIRKLNGYISSTPLYYSAEWEITSRMDRFIAAQRPDFVAIRSHLTYGYYPAQQLVYWIRDDKNHKVLAWFVITYWAEGGRLYSLSLCSESDPPHQEIDAFLIEQLGEKTLHQEIFLPQ